MSDPQKTPLYSQHQQLQAKIVDFGGWALPVNYGSQIEEHMAVRQSCGMFDVSHMTVWDIQGDQTVEFLSTLLANDIRKASKTAGKAIYSCMLNESGGVIDDLIAYYLDEQSARVISNAGTRDKVKAWLEKQAASFDITLSEQPELALIAVQGPLAKSICQQVLEPSIFGTVDSLARFQGAFYENNFIGRTGYTGEDGYEFVVDVDTARNLWEQLIEAGVQPCGLGARDTLRLEAGMALYGNDLDEDHTPLESGLAWTVSISDDRDFIGKGALKESSKNMIGLKLLDKGVLRGHQAVLFEQQEIGEITSGTFSPSLEASIGLARVNTSLQIGSQVDIAVRKRLLKAEVVAYPFYRKPS